MAEAQTRYEKTRAFRHDLQNHLFVLDGLLSAGRTEEARRYLEKLEAASAALAARGIKVVDQEEIEQL